MGITTAAEADVYDNVKNTRVSFSPTRLFRKYSLVTKDFFNRPWNSPPRSQQKSYRRVRGSTPVSTDSCTVIWLHLFQIQKLESLRPEPSLQLDANLVGLMFGIQLETIADVPHKLNHSTLPIQPLLISFRPRNNRSALPSVFCPNLTSLLKNSIYVRMNAVKVC